MREALRVQMVEFGRTPQQLFSKKHPKRRVGRRPTLSNLLCFRPSAAPLATQPTQSVQSTTTQAWLTARFSSRALWSILMTQPDVTCPANSSASKFHTCKAVVEWLLPCSFSPAHTIKLQHKRQYAEICSTYWCKRQTIQGSLPELSYQSKATQARGTVLCHTPPTALTFSHIVSCVREAESAQQCHGLQTGKSAQPVARAIARLTSSKPFIRQATLAWLEQAGCRQDPEYLGLASHTELLGVVRALREGCGPSPDKVRLHTPNPVSYISSLHMPLLHHDARCEVFWMWLCDVAGLGSAGHVRAGSPHSGHLPAEPRTHTGGWCPGAADGAPVPPADSRAWGCPVHPVPAVQWGRRPLEYLPTLRPATTLGAGEGWDCPARVEGHSGIHPCQTVPILPEQVAPMALLAFERTQFHQDWVSDLYAYC